MSISANLCNQIFKQSIEAYHKQDHIDTPIQNPYESESIQYLLYLKNWIDTVQWHLEDIIRSPQISPEALVGIKRRIDASNQQRTDVVEQIDDWFLHFFKNAPRHVSATLNSETPAWLIDRMSILELKIYHMQEQAHRQDVGEEHVQKCKEKLQILLEQEKDLAQCLDELIQDILQGKKYMKVYRQMKMYNDASLNPILYGMKK